MIENDDVQKELAEINQSIIEDTVSENEELLNKIREYNLMEKVENKQELQSRIDNYLKFGDNRVKAYNNIAILTQQSRELLAQNKENNTIIIQIQNQIDKYSNLTERIERSRTKLHDDLIDTIYNS